MTIIIRKQGNKQIREETKYKHYYRNKEIALIDYTETTAQQHFCTIELFNGEKGLIPQHEIEINKI